MRRFWVSHINATSKARGACFALFVLITTAPAYAQTLLIPLDPNRVAPASDLPGFSTEEAAAFRKQGGDLSHMDPAPNDLWRAEPNDAQTLAPTRARLPLLDPRVFSGTIPAELRYQDAFNAQGRLRFRATIKDLAGQTQVVSVSVSLEHHGALARSELLARLGYPVPEMRRLPQARVVFSSSEERAVFLDGLTAKLLASKDRWVMSESDTSLLLQDIVIEAVESVSENGFAVPDFYWGSVPPGIVSPYRALRALIVPLVLLDYSEAVNFVSWEGLSVDGDALVVSHRSAQSFQGAVDSDDVRWILRKIARLSRADWQAIVGAAQYPPDISALMLEKTIARRNHWVKVLSEGQSLSYSRNLSVGKVLKGKLTLQCPADSFKCEPGYASRFSINDPESPINVAEMGRFFLIEGITKGISKLSEVANRELLTFRDRQDLERAQSQKIAAEIRDFFEKNPTAKTYTIPVRAWGGPVAGASLQGGRSVVTGSYYGGETGAGAQLVDSVSVNVQVGAYGAIQGVQNAFPFASGNVVLSRSFIHVRPIQSVKEGLTTSWKDLWVPSFMSRLGSLLGEAGDLKSLQAQIESELKPGELFLVTDSVLVGGRVGAALPLTPLVNLSFLGASPALSMSVGASSAVLSRTTIAKSPTGLQIYLQRIKPKTKDLTLDLNFWLSLATFNATDKDGNAETEAFNLDGVLASSASSTSSGVADDDRRALKLRAALKEIFDRNSSEVLRSEFRPYLLSHDVDSKLSRFKFLRYRSFKVDEIHRLRITPPEDEAAEKRYDPKDHVRELISARRLTLRGVNDYGLFSDVINAVAQGYGPENRAGDNPAGNFLGRSQWTSVQTQREITPSRAGSAVSVSVVERHFAGWRMGQDALFSLIDQINTRFGALGRVSPEVPLLRKEVFANTKKLELFDINVALAIDQIAQDRILESMHARPGEFLAAATALVEVDGNSEFYAWCKNKALPLFKRFGDQSMYVYRAMEGGKEVRLNCVRPWMKRVLELRQSWINRKVNLTDAIERLRATSAILLELERHMPTEKLLSWIGREHFDLEVRISGFRRGEEEGDQAFVSDRVGSGERIRMHAAFERLIESTGLLSSEVHARYLTEGF